MSAVRMASIHARTAAALRSSSAVSRSARHIGVRKSSMAAVQAR
jgi:hypothetical protein